MKYLPLLLAAVLVAGSAAAQDAGTRPEKTKIKTKVGDARPWALKWNPESLLFGKIGLSGERQLRGRKSVTFGIGIPVKQHITRDPTEYRVDLDAKTFSAQAGYRMYLGKRPLRGFYFEPYLKYVHFDGSGTFDDKNTSSSTTHYIFASDVSYSGGGIGAQLGVQFQVAKVVVLDLFLLGPEANIGNSEGRFRDISPNSGPVWNSGEAERNIRNFIDDIPIIRNNVTYEIDNANRTVIARYKGFTPGLRLGASVGIRF